MSYWQAAQFGEAVAAIREQRGLSLRVAASEAGVFFTVLHRLERAPSSDIRIGNIAAMARWAGLSLDSFIDALPGNTNGD